MGKRSATAAAEQVVNPELTAKALAKAVCDGDIVNFRFLFSPFSPARRDSTERFETAKYAYLLPAPEEERVPAFSEALRRIRESETWAHIQRELEAKRPAQLPADLLLTLADNAVRLGKYTSAAQAYEMLRIRGQMQEEFAAQGEHALEAGDIVRAARAFVIAASLEYDYAAFPEPLPSVPNYQTRALMLHGDYPERPEDSLPLQNDEVFLRTAISYLLLHPSLAAKLESRPIEIRRAFFYELVRLRDPKWDEFAKRYREACRMARDFAKRVQRALERRESGSTTIEDELYAQLGEDPMKIPAQLLGRSLEKGEWWQYLKELAYEHPPAILFIARQVIGETETLFPRYRQDSPIPSHLGLTDREGTING